jgi:1A family penicillin-binding protein
MPKRTPPAAAKNSRSRSQESPPEHERTIIGTLVGWPFALIRYFTRGLPPVIRWPVRAILSLGVLGAVFGTGFGTIYYLRARPYDMTNVGKMPERTVILDRNGHELGRIHGEKRDVIPLSEVSEHFRNAILAREDARFYNHGPIDLIGVARATVRNLKERGLAEGASTITMQLARNSFPLGGGNKLQEFDRKLLEIAVSYRIEEQYSKDEILEHYVNRIFWGHSIMGIEEAAQTYFEKPAKNLTLSESALLAGIVRGPNAFSPFNDIDKAKRERDTTLASMVDKDFITEDEAKAASAEPITIRPEWRRVMHASYAMDAIRRDLEYWLEQENIELGGLTITTTIDSRIQERAEKALDARLTEVERTPGYPHQTRAKWNSLPETGRPRPEYIQGAVVVIENSTGAVLAVVGGRNADESKFNRALQANRQIGSVFKPFVYLAAFDAGLRPNTPISDDPIRHGEIKGAASWTPHNSDGKFNGIQTASYGLIRSRNTMSVRIGDFAGLKKVTEVANRAGFAQVPATPASYLGSFETTPWHVASAYTIFPNGGQRFRPFLISEIKDKDGNVVYTTPPLAYAAASSGSTWAISNILQEVTTSGTAAAVKRLGFDFPAGGKTGTTNDFKDAWFTGYTSSLTCTVWVGMDTPKKTITGGYGSTLALPVWVEVMKTAERLGYPAKKVGAGVTLKPVTLCRQSGQRATPGCKAAGAAFDELVPADILPPERDFCTIHPLRAEPVSAADVARQPPTAAHPAVPAGQPLRALPVGPDDLPPAAPRALPVDEVIREEEDIPRALPVR